MKGGRGKLTDNVKGTHREVPITALTAIILL